MRLGLTQEELARQIQVALSALQNYEQDRSSVKTPVLERMRKAKIDVDYVVYGRDVDPAEPLDAALWERVKAWMRPTQTMPTASHSMSTSATSASHSSTGGCGKRTEARPKWRSGSAS